MEYRTKCLAAGIAALILLASLTAFSFAEKTGAGTRNTIHVACVGDSITIDTGYPEYLGTILGANYTVGDFGVGRTTVSLDFNKPYLNQTMCQNALNFAPNIVVIMLGTNDAYLSWQQRSNFTSDYKTLIALFQALPSKPEIFIAVPPPVFSNTMGLNSTILENDVIPLVNQTVSDVGLTLIDTHTPFIDHPEDFKDGVHPNIQGAKIVATTIFNSITQPFA
jgi:acyl-CoA thioesterase I